MRINKLLFSMGLGLLITFGLCFGIAQASGQVAQPNLPAATIFYVDANAGGNATGLSWTNAFTTVQDALAVAASGDQVWVAKGIYYPDQGAGQTNDAISSTFVLTDGVTLYGGFDPGSADPWGDRDGLAHPTVLSGDIDQETNPDGTDSRGVVIDTASIQGSNAYHVVSNSGVTVTAVMDGFIITAGYVPGFFPDWDSSGGGMYNDHSSPTLVAVTFSGNLAGYGGGMYNSYSSPTLTDVTFSGNSASQRGAGMYNSYSNPTLTHVTFFDNSANNEGGGMYNRENSSPTLAHTVFSKNYSGSKGGGMRNEENSSPTLTAVTFSGNMADDDGGGMSNWLDSSPALTDVSFSGNSANGAGGGMDNVSDSSPTLTDVTFSGNSAGDFGGGMSNGARSNPILTDVTFSRNASAREGGGMYNIGECNLTLMDVTFSGNSAGEEGGGMYNNASNLTLTNVAFSGNSTEQRGGGMVNYYSSLTLTNVTIASNSAGDNFGGGIYNYYSSPALVNTILWANEAITGTQIFNDGTSNPMIRFSDIQDAFDGGTWNPALGSDGGDNLDADPLFERNPDPGSDGDWGGVGDDYGDLRPKPGSPVINEGTNTGCPATDLDGGPRPLDAICDMGAYETGYVLQISKSVDDDTPAPGQTIIFTIVVANSDLVVTGGLISDTLPAGLNFLGPISLQPAGSGSVGSMPPTLASDLTIAYASSITVTFPVMVSSSLISGTQLINTATISTNEVLTPVSASTTITVIGEQSGFPVYLPLIIR